VFFSLSPFLSHSFYLTTRVTRRREKFMDGVPETKELAIHEQQNKAKSMPKIRRVR